MAVTTCLWDRIPMDESRKLHLAGAIRIGDDLSRGREVLHKTGGAGSVQVFCVYQNSSVWRRLIVEAKKSGARVVVYSEAPCEMCLGLKALLKRLFYRWVLPWRLRSAVASADCFISQSGFAGMPELRRLGWKDEQIVPFGYVSPRRGGERVERGEGVERVARLRVLHLGSEAPYRGVKVAEKAARLAGVELVKTGGKLSEDQLVREIRRADVVVGCGLCEPWGMRINDAVLEGTPVIVSDGMGASVLCRWYGCGCVTRRGDVADLAHALRRAADDPSVLSAWRDGAQRAAREFTPEARAQMWLEAALGESLS